MSKASPPGEQAELPDVFARIRRPCGHAEVYFQDGECLRCNQRFNTPAERDVDRELVGDSGGGWR